MLDLILNGGCPRLSEDDRDNVSKDGSMERYMLDFLL